MVERHHLAVDDAIGKSASGGGNRGELVRPVQSLARAHESLAAFDAQLHPIAIELDLMHPVLPGGRTAHTFAKLRSDKGRHRGDANTRAPLGLCLWNRETRCRLADFVLAVRMPHGIGLEGLGLSQHEWLGSSPLAGSDL